METKNKVVAKPIVSQTAGFIETALANNAPIETLERLFVLYREVEAGKARAAFVQALADFQKDCPVIGKTKKVLNKDGRSVRYQYAPLESIIAEIREPLGKYGLSYTWTVENQENKLTATAKITHVQGHAETSAFTIPIDTEGFMTAPQKYASAQTFAKRYALCNALGIATGDEDTDATDVEKEKEPKNEKAKIVFLLRRLQKETATKEQVEKSVLGLTQLALEEKNYGEIVGRLEIMVKEQEEFDQTNHEDTNL